jgi:hypothetical protein
MTDAEKLADYDRLIELLNDRIALEKTFRRKKYRDAVQSVRAEAYRDIVVLILGAGALPRS